MLGKRVLSPSHHSPHAAPASNNNHSAIGAATAATQNHLDFGGLSKKRQRLGGQDSQGKRSGWCFQVSSLLNGSVAVHGASRGGGRDDVGVDLEVVLYGHMEFSEIARTLETSRL